MAKKKTSRRLDTGDGWSVYGDDEEHAIGVIEPEVVEKRDYLLNQVTHEQHYKTWLFGQRGEHAQQLRTCKSLNVAVREVRRAAAVVQAKAQWIDANTNEV